MVNYDLPWNPNRIEQRFGRIHRIGQTEACHLWNLVSRGNLRRRRLPRFAREARTGPPDCLAARFLSEINRTEIQLDLIKTGRLRGINPTYPWMTIPRFRRADLGDLDPVGRASLALQPRQCQMNVAWGKEDPGRRTFDRLQPARIQQTPQTRPADNTSESARWVIRASGIDSGKKKT
jgi:hypothetical protein